MKTTDRTLFSASMLCLAAFFLLLVSTGSWAISVSPSPSYSGSYTVSWTLYPTKCGIEYWSGGEPYIFCKRLQESINSGGWVTVGTATNALSHAFRVPR